MGEGAFLGVAATGPILIAHFITGACSLAAHGFSVWQSWVWHQLKPGHAMISLKLRQHIHGICIEYMYKEV